MAFRDPSGAPIEPRISWTPRTRSASLEADIAKLISDAKERKISVGILVARDESQLRQLDRECRWGQEDGVWVLRTTRQWLPRDLEVLRPLLERMRTDGPDFLQRNAALADEVRRTFADIDAIEKELGKASKAIHSVSGLVAKYKVRLNSLCDGTGAAKKLPVPQRGRNDIQICRRRYEAYERSVRRAIWSSSTFRSAFRVGQWCVFCFCGWHAEIEELERLYGGVCSPRM